ncbi:hypothetical protein FHT87_004133 [Rhizobium sp. BK316]|jgi:hypothetical protein|uniref:nuclear transport factor 2 family protein n=1 Tax=Rhizobium sp. BK316 TaxID=2587053 RepID=UPI0018441042|nr:DUF4440 domain-containing protein [Rhizobium sp. BK316]MBB3410201.1 hypothetical protein [Rhizobium sp. BK316]
MYPGSMSDLDLDHILRELAAREPIFHRREFGTSRADLERMTDDNFWEIGASGKVYQRGYAIETSLARYENGPEPHEWPCRDFTITMLTDRLFLLSYILEEPQRVTRHSTIWRRADDGWKVVFHQGTPTV